VILKGIKRIFLNQRGFSLTEVMVGGAVLAGVGLTASQLFKDQKFAQRRITDDQKLALFHGDLAKTMMDPSHCNTTMKVFYPTSGAITPRSIDRLYKCTSGCIDSNSTSDRSYDAYTTGAFTGSAFLSVGQGTDTWSTTTTDKGVTWKIESMNIVDSQTKTGPVTLRIKYRNSFFDGKSISKDIVLSTRFYGGVFKECVSSQISSVDNFNNDFCKTFNLSESVVSTDGVMARWDEATQTCKFDGAKDCTSSSGMHADGIGPDGIVNCKSITTPADAINLQNPTTTTCLPPLKPRVIYNTTTKTFGIQCEN
jgi:type II secretory pathway pseudopilin PulG